MMRTSSQTPEEWEMVTEWSVNCLIMTASGGGHIGGGATVCVKDLDILVFRAGGRFFRSVVVLECCGKLWPVHFHLRLNRQEEETLRKMQNQKFFFLRKDQMQSQRDNTICSPQVPIDPNCDACKRTNALFVGCHKRPERRTDDVAIPTKFREATSANRKVVSEDTVVVQGFFRIGSRVIHTETRAPMTRSKVFNSSCPPPKQPGKI